MKQRSPSELADSLVGFRELLGRYAGTLDLMSMGGLERLDDHLRDARAYAGVIVGLSPTVRRVLDVGSGAGLPAVVIAAALPDVEVELVERRRKRSAFLDMAVASIDHRRVTVRGGDVRSLSGPPVDVVTAQAVGRFRDVYALTRHRHGPTVSLLSRKGPGWQDEVDELAAATDSAVAVAADVPLAHHGTLVAVRLPGGMPCRSSG